MSEEICRNCGHEIIEVKALNGWAHKCECELSWHEICTFTGDEDQYDECECKSPAPTQEVKGTQKKEGK